MALYQAGEQWHSSGLFFRASFPQLPHRKLNKDMCQFLHLCWDSPECGDRQEYDAEE